MKVRLTMLMIIVPSSQPKECTTTARVQILRAIVVHASDRRTMMTITVAVTSYRGTCSIAIDPAGFLVVSFSIKI